MQFDRGVVGCLVGQLLFHAGPLAGGEPLGGRGSEHLRDDLDVAQARLPGAEHRGGGSELGGERGAVERGARTDLIGGGDAATRLEPFPAEQITEGPGGRRVAALGERPAPLQRRHCLDGDPVQLPADALAERQDRQQLVVRCAGSGGRLQLGDRLREQAVRGAERGGRHVLIVLEHVFEYVLFVAGRWPFGDGGDRSSRHSSTTCCRPSSPSCALIAACRRAIHQVISRVGCDDRERAVDELMRHPIELPPASTTGPT
ncbi:hypothetical protein HF526_00175 [Pseudonocardia sp. K10HN5]|uniref:Uncharacterized protein n=1 Tax=Pseudonocardia acidicola TaxID=2724939 RepID=A0ABX1S5L5_9PSEU|nr:hypothetical protein [Pseudonocardia acidicola]NMH95748.1 hypothetical protein [Pseudonocardia acidicola]